jgi:hypothetical protein
VSNASAISKLDFYPTTENLNFEMNVEHVPQREKKRKAAITAVRRLDFPQERLVAESISWQGVREFEENIDTTRERKSGRLTHSHACTRNVHRGRGRERESVS